VAQVKTFKHYSNTKITKLTSKRQEHHDHLFKPVGLWISDEDDYGWEQWCTDQGYSPGSNFLGEFVYDVELEPNANILWIKHMHELLSFTNKYRHEQNQIFSNKDYTMWLDWKTIAKEYDGIVITPYQYQARMGIGTTWYYPWDCASGCIWNKRAIKSIKETVNARIISSIANGN
jgi:hypothetical protein